MRDKLIDYYRILLELGWLVADEDGNVSVQLGDEELPATIDGKRLILPTREQMKDTNWDNRVGFHPLREAFNLGVSDVVANLRDQYVQRLNVTISYMLKEFVHIGNDQKNQKNLTTEQSQVLECLSDVSDTTVKQLDALIKNTKARNSADQFINIYIRRGGTVKGEKYGRAGIVTFPIYEHLVSSKEPINGVKFNAKDRSTLIKLYEFIFPTLRVDREFLNVGINSRTAPFLESLVRATINVVDQIVETAQPYRDLFSIPHIFSFPSDIGVWKEVFDSKDLAERLARAVPALNSNENGAEMDLEREAERIRDKEREQHRDADPRTERVTAEPTTPAPISKGSSGRMVLGASSFSEVPRKGVVPKKTEPTPTRSEREIRAEIEREQRQAAERERRQREREEEEERRREEEEYRREREERRRADRDRRDDRGRDRRDDREERRTGDIFDDNPVLRGNHRDERDRYYDDDRRDRRVRDMRDRYIDDRYDRGRDRDRGRGRDRRDYYDDRDDYYDRRDDRRDRHWR